MMCVILYIKHILQIQCIVYQIYFTYIVLNNIMYVYTIYNVTQENFDEDFWNATIVKTCLGFLNEIHSKIVNNYVHFHSPNLKQTLIMLF